MPGISTSHAVALLRHVFENATVAGVGDTVGLRGSVTAGSLYVALHTAAPTAAQDDDETTYAGYARKDVARADAQWTVQSTPSGGKVWVTNAGALTFPQMTSGNDVTITHASVGVALSGATARLFSNALASPVVVSVGESPSIAIGALKISIEVNDA